MYFIITSLAILGSIALLAAVVLYVCSRRFAVKEDSRIAEVAALLPQANCGGCGFPGCAGMAAAMVKAADGGSIEGLSCPVADRSSMDSIASLLGMKATESKPMIATLMCRGECALRPRVVEYDGLHTCHAMHACGSGDTACSYGCLGAGDCEASCSFGGITINPDTRLPEVSPSLCTACGSCVKACPRNILQIVPRGNKSRRIYVACSNRDRGAAVVKACGVSCIGCGKCVRECKFDAITVTDNVAHIDPDKCRLCRKCEKACPRHAIVAEEFPQPKVAEDDKDKCKDSKE